MATYRIEISGLPQWQDARGNGVAQQITRQFGCNVNSVRVRDVYTFDADITAQEAEKIAELLYNPVLQCWSVGEAKSANYVEAGDFNYVISGIWRRCRLATAWLGTGFWMFDFGK